MTWTSLLPVWARALESRRPRPLFDDHLADRFLTAYAGELGPLPELGIETSPLWSAVFHGVTVRTAYFDAAIRRAGAPQVVVLGAGLETRAYRLGLGPEVTVFEIDRAETLSFKERVLAGEEPTCQRVPIVAEVGVDDLGALLKAAGLDPSVPTVWLAEGFLFYLTPAQAGNLLDETAALSAPGSVLLGEVFDRPYRADDLPVEQMTAEDAATWLRFVAAFRGTPAIPVPAAWLAAHGWTAVEVTDQVGVGASLGREAPAFYERARDWLFEGRH
jgi:methyltransferase (TIGR00027 family)